MKANNSATSYLIAGLGLMAGGGLLMASNLGWIDEINISALWPLAPLCIGIYMILFPSEDAQRQDGAWPLLIGAFFLECNLNFTGLGWTRLWPVLIISFGLLLIWHGMTSPKPGRLSENGNGS